MVDKFMLDNFAPPKTEKYILVIESDPQHLQALQIALDFIGYLGIFLSKGRGLEKILVDQPTPEAILLGQSEISRTEVFRQVRARDPLIPIFLVRHPGDDTVLNRETMSCVSGCLEYPIRFQPLIEALRGVRVRSHQTEPTRGNTLRRMVGTSAALRHIRGMIRQVARTDASVLILGESGTGKEIVARALHEDSLRAQNPFIPMNCGAIPADLLESELFGHEKGAFTGAISARAGRFELAEGGTLFLDEIGDMSLAMQVKLLRVLQERCFERVGGTKTIHADVRIIAATHRNLEEWISTGRFRCDLYYRLNVFPIEVPPLRERTEDIPLLVDEIVSRLETEKYTSVRLTANAMVALTNYLWPGNIRELSNLIERLAILYPHGLVDAQDLPPKFRGSVVLAPVSSATEIERVFLTQAVTQDPLRHLLPSLPEEGLDLKVLLSNLESQIIRQALERNAWVVARAAEFLRMRRTTLVEKCRKYGLSRELPAEER